MLHLIVVLGWCTACSFDCRRYIVFSIPKSSLARSFFRFKYQYFSFRVSQSFTDFISSVIFLSPSIHQHRDGKGRSNSALHSDVYVTLSYSSKQRHMTAYECFSPTYWETAITASLLWWNACECYKSIIIFQTAFPLWTLYTVTEKVIECSTDLLKTTNLMVCFSTWFLISKFLTHWYRLHVHSWQGCHHHSRIRSHPPLAPPLKSHLSLPAPTLEPLRRPLSSGGLCITTSRGHHSELWCRHWIWAERSWERRRPEDGDSTLGRDAKTLGRSGSRGRGGHDRSLLWLQWCRMLSQGYYEEKIEERRRLEERIWGLQADLGN